MLKRLKYLLPLVLALATEVAASGQVTNVLILYDSPSPFGWYGNLHAKMLANLLGHFELSWQIKPVEEYSAGDMDRSRATFYLGTEYRDPFGGLLFPAAFTNDVLTTTNTLCWFKDNLWQVSWATPAFNAKFGLNFSGLDSSGYSNIFYKGETFPKNQADPELGVVEILDTNLATIVVAAWKTNAGNLAESVPYIVRASNFWYVADSPFGYLGEEDRYVAFADLLHDILGMDHPESHHALIRLEDVGIRIYSTNTLIASVNSLRSNSVPFSVAVIPVYTDPLGVYNGGVPEQHHISDATDTNSVAFLNALRYAVSNGGQVIIEGYTHQYSSAANPFSGVSGEDFEFWRETFSTNVPRMVALYQPTPEDSEVWAYGRVSAAANELAKAGLSWVGWFPPHYVASGGDYKVFATNFPITIQRVMYFSDDYSPTNAHLGGQLFPYVVHADCYGQKIMPENVGYYGPSQIADPGSHSTADIIRIARKNLVVRDGWASAFYHGYYGTSNLQAIIAGIRALGYTFVPTAPSGRPVITLQPRAPTTLVGNSMKLSVAVVGAEPFHYQWQFNGTNLPGSTNAIFNLPCLQSSNAGVYTVIVTNADGITNSAPAAVQVLANPPQIGILAGSASGEFAIFFNTVSGATYIVQSQAGLTNSTWRSMTNVVGSGGIMIVPATTASGSNQYYRVLIP